MVKKRITAGQLTFLAPLLLLVAVFALYPILCSVVYSFFDYRTNDQTVSGLYTSTSFNARLFAEDCDYIAYYLSDEITLVEGADKAELEAVSAEASAMFEIYKDTEKTLSLSKADEQKLIAYIDDAETRINRVYDANAGVAFYNRDKIGILANELRSCIIKSNFTGLAAYGALLRDTRFFDSLGHTVLFTFVSVALELTLGMLLALIMNKAMKGIGVVRTAALVPWAIPTAVSALMWSYMYDGGSGVISHMFASLGLISSPEVMLLSANGAMAAAILADVWKTTPYMALLLLAGLQIIDRGLYESAKIDGAGTVRTFFSITLPMLKPSMLVALLFRTLDAFRVFDLITVLTGGGPGGATETLSIYAYKLMIGQSNYGYGAVVVIAMALFVAAIAFVFIKVLGTELIADD